MEKEKQIEENANTIAACMKMPISYICKCKKDLKYKPSSMICRKCILVDRVIRSIFNDNLENALENNDLEKAINILSEVK